MIYEERYGFDSKTALVLVISGVFVAVAILLPDMSAVVRILTLVLFGGGGLLMLAAALSRKVAMRVDQSGITLGGSPLRYRQTTQHVPLPDIEAVVLWRQHTAANIPWIGILRRADAPPPSPVPTGGRRAMNSTAAALSGAPDERLMQCATAINGWKLDTAELKAALQELAPHVRVDDHR
ncbi:hypothetical protein [Nocardia sp. XZ_19_385]|uniref:hypothetical protein n=1 Tax=Nocardia sp. XZ_19_385 TaxID=2769488 RepID=UPI00188FD1DE|nr:hypothetical protein [Nocardia sp. XZ_19_385]